MLYITSLVLIYLMTGSFVPFFLMFLIFSHAHTHTQTHTHCILFLQEINKLTQSIVNGWPQQKQQWLQLPNMKHTHTMS